MIKNIFKKSYLLIVLVLIFGFSFFSVYANGTTEDSSIENPLNATSFDQLISSIAYWIFMIAIPLATLMFLIGGFMFMTSGGNEQRVTQAKKTMLWSAVGLAICLIGAGFTSIIRELLGAK